MKKRYLPFILLFCGILAGALAFGVSALLRLAHPLPHTHCEAMAARLSFNGIIYDYPIQADQPPTLSASDLGPVVGRVGSGPHDVQPVCDYSLAPGQQVYRLKGYAPFFRLAVQTRNGISYVEATYNPQAKTGADLFDIREQVQSIVVIPVDPAQGPTRVIHDPTTIQQLVGKLMSAPVTATCSSGNERDALLFHLKDGSTVERSYWPTERQIATGGPQCVHLPPEFATLLASQ